MTRYKTILVDPPWPYSQTLGRGKKFGDTTGGGLPYKSLTLEQIKSLPINGLADKDCMLFLWTTNSFIHEAFHVVEAWHFTYKTMVTWGKTQIGLGYWLRGQTEHFLLAVKGNPRTKMTGPHGTTGSSWSTLIIDKRTAHSEKPQVFSDMIEEKSEPPRIELFARRQRMGWDVWGNEVYSSINLEEL